MALDTTIGGTSADSYGTLADYIAYVTSRIDAAYSGVTETQELNLRRAAEYIDREYKFPGTQQYQTQALAWPRNTSLHVDGWPINSDSIPADIISAQFEAAYQFEVNGVDPFPSLTAGTVKRERSKAGPVEVETEYEAGRSTPRLIAVDRLLAPYTSGAPAGQIRVGRG